MKPRLYFCLLVCVLMRFRAHHRLRRWISRVVNDRSSERLHWFANSIPCSCPECADTFEPFMRWVQIR